jgi:hypothetical protein
VIRTSLAAFALLGCGSRTDLEEQSVVDASADSCFAETPVTTCATPTCTGGKCVANLTTQPLLGAFVLDDVHVFWSTETALIRADKCGAHATVLLGCRDGVAAHGLDAANVYFSTRDQTPHTKLFREPKAGGVPTQLAEFDEDVVGFAIVGDAIFMTLIGPQNSRLARMPAAGGVLTTLFSNNVEAGLAVDAHQVFFGVNSSVMRMNEDGTAVSMLADVSNPGSEPANGMFVLDASYVYSTSGCGDVRRVARDGSTPKGEVLGAVSTSKGIACVDNGAIALDAAFVYLAYGGNGATPSSIFRVSKTGGALDTVLQLDDNPLALATDSTGIFWSDETSLRVLTSF